MSKRKRPPRRMRAANLAAMATPSDAEIAAVDAWLAVNGWQDFEGKDTAQCPRCASIGTRFVSRAPREDGPRVLACVDCATKGAP